MASILANRTWTLVLLPPGAHAILVKRVYKFKTGTFNSTLKFKVRLIARGYQQLSGLNYTETFSPVVKWATLRLLISFAIQHVWPLLHLNVKSAFVNGELTEVVYLHQPPGYVVPTFETLVCHLHRAIYGLC